MCRGRSGRQPPVVVTEDLISGPIVAIGQRRASPADFQNVGGEAATCLLLANALKPLFGGSAHGGSHRFAGDCGKLANRFLRRCVLDVERHGNTGRKFLPRKIVAATAIGNNAWRPPSATAIPHLIVMLPIIPAQSWSEQISL